MEAIKIDIGIDSNDRKAIADGLMNVLADTYTLYLKTQNYHWNVTGPHFTTLHALFETQYIDLASANDQIAERIRSLGFVAPGSYTQFSDLTKIKESVKPPKAEQMVKDILSDHETVIKTLYDALKSAEKANDQPTIDVITQRLAVHEKNAWMLRSFLS